MVSFKERGDGVRIVVTLEDLQDGKLTSQAISEIEELTGWNKCDRVFRRLVKRIKGRSQRDAVDESWKLLQYFREKQRSDQTCGRNLFKKSDANNLDSEVDKAIINNPDSNADNAFGSENSTVTCDIDDQQGLDISSIMALTSEQDGAKMCDRLENWDFNDEIDSADMENDFSEFINILEIQLYMERQNIADIEMDNIAVKEATEKMCRDDKSTDGTKINVMENVKHEVETDGDLDLGESMTKCVSDAMSGRTFDKESWDNVLKVWCNEGWLGDFFERVFCDDPKYDMLSM